MDLLNLLEYVKVEYLILIPFLFGLGKMIKYSNKVSDRYIPIVLMVVGVLFSLGIGGVNIYSIIQGAIACTVTVWGNEAITQLNKDE